MILSIDQGTTGTTVMVIRSDGEILGRGYSEFRQIFPEPGWVSHDAGEIWDTTVQVMGEAIGNAGVSGGEIGGIGISNQRETTVIWDRETGVPVHDAIVWQCRRTADICARLRAEGMAETVREKTGLVIDAYFSATKVMWLLDHVHGLRERAERGEVCFGTIDSYLLFRLTGGAVHGTDYTNASRTMCYHIHVRVWDAELLEAFGIPEAIEHEKSGLVIARAQLNRLGEALLEVLDLPEEERARFGVAARERIEATFYPGAEASALEGVLRRLSANTSS